MNYKFLIFAARPLQAPSNFRVSATTSTSITFNWDTLTNVSIDGYFIWCLEGNNFSVSTALVMCYMFTLGSVNACVVCLS